MAVPAQKNISIYKGDTFSLVFTLMSKDADGNVGDPVDLTGAEVTSQIRATEDSGSAMIDFTAEHDDDGGTITLSLTAAQTTTLTTNGVWDVQVEYPDGTVRTYLKGVMSLIKEVTR